MILICFLILLNIVPACRISQVDIPADTLITLERTGCLGSCPVYKLTINADGTVEFRGMHVKEGRMVSDAVKKSHISRDKLASLLQAFQTADYWSFKDQYSFGDKACGESWTDYPSAITSIRVGGKTKSVDHYYGCQRNERLKILTELESKIDDVTNTKQWLR